MKINIHQSQASFSSANGLGEAENAKMFLKLHAYLRRRGFIVTKDPRIEKDYKILSKSHRYGFKGSLEFKSEYYPNGFRYEFFQNINTKNASGGEYDFDKYKMMPYMIKLAFRNEMLRLQKYLIKSGHECEYPKELSSIERMFKDKRESCHSKAPKELFTLEDFEKQMSDYDHNQNSKDKNGKKIKCAEIKYFYDEYGSKRLMKGQAVHNLNNMWWVVCNGVVRNIASFNLFDYEPGMPFRKVLSIEAKLNRMQQALKIYENKQQYEKCIKLRNTIRRINSEPLYKVYSIKNGAWWCANNNGYTSDENKAGLYVESNILTNQDYYNNGRTTKSIKV